ncbi:MAG: LamG-like jellyroll fold domain-containing protein [Chloroflexota bacterium]
MYTKNLKIKKNVVQKGSKGAHLWLLPLLLTLVLLATSLSSVSANAVTNNALSFDGFNDHITISNPDSFNVGSDTDFTIEAVIMTTKSREAIFSKMGASDIEGYQFWVFDGRLLLEWSYGQNISSNVLVNDGQCHHVAAVVDRSAQNAKLYVDGVLAANVTHPRYGNNIDNTNPVYIGQERTLNSAFRFSGNMDEVAFFNTARTASEIAASATTQLSGAESGLVGYWQFDEGVPSGANASVTMLPDASGNGNDGTLHNFALNGGSSNWIASQCAQSSPDPELNVADATVDASNASISVPVDFTSNGQSIASVGFSIDYDASCLSYDSVSGLPIAGFVDSVAHDAGDSDGELDIAIYDATEPVSTLSDGTLLSIIFNVSSAPACTKTDGSTTDVSINFSTDPSATFGDENGVDVTGTTSDGTITLTFNATPTDIGLSPSSVAENQPSGTAVGTLSTTDPDVGDSHTYALVSGTGDDDNGSFAIDGNQIKTAASFDFETKNGYTVRVRTTDNGGLNGTFEKQLTITVNDVNDAPTDIGLSPSSVAENSVVDTIVGSLTTTDQDAGDSPSYTFVAGTGDDDNSSFTIDGTQIKTSAIFDFEAKSSYTVRVRTTDNGTPNLSFEKQLTITVTDVNEAPVAQNDTVDPLAKVVVGTESYNIDVLANDSDPENDSLTVDALTQPAAGSATDNDSDVTFTGPDTNGTSTFTYQATDGSLNSGDATVTVSHVADDLRGDCNGNGSVTAADFIAVVLEIFDAGSDPQHNGNPAWWRIFDGGYAGSPLGCDANDSKNGPGNDSESVTVADLSCTVLRFFGASDCSGGTLSAPNGVQEAATLSTQQDANGDQVQVLLDSRGNEVASAAFSLVLNPQAVAFDAADADGDGVPDAVMVNAPAHMSRIVIWDAERSELHVAIFGVSAELATLEDGALATVTVDGANGRSPLTFGHMSLGNTQGGDIVVEALESGLSFSEETVIDVTLPVDGK